MRLGAGAAAGPLLLAGLLASWPRSSAPTAEIRAQSCVDGFVVHRDKIIRTTDSLRLGAEYLSNYEVGSKLECAKWCCDTERCDVFVYEERSLGNCYLFRCGPPHDFKCKFTGHANYSSAVLAAYSPPPAPDAIDELNSLRRSELATSTGSSGATTAASAGTSSTGPPPVSAEPAKASCSRNQFECRSSGDCIAIYNACDGIPQCADGSDEALELGCPQERSSPPLLLPPPVQRQPYQHQTQPLGLVPDLVGYQRMMQQHQQYPVHLYPAGDLAPASDTQPADAGWTSYQTRGRELPAAPPPAQQQQEQQQRQRQPQQQQQQQPQPSDELGGQGGAVVPAQQQHQQHQQQQQQQPRPLPPVDYGQWQAPPAAPGHWPASLDERQPAASPAEAYLAHAYVPESGALAEQQVPRILNDKPSGVRPDELERPGGPYGQELSRGYAPYYPAVLRQPESVWRESGGGGGGGGDDDEPGPQRQPSPVATAPPGPQRAPYQWPSTTSSTAQPCDSAESKQPGSRARAPAAGRPSRPDGERTAEHQVAPNGAGEPAGPSRTGHELELKTLAQAHLQEHKGVAMAEHLGRAGRVSPRIEELQATRPKGAVISLALGLGVTAVMAVLIACRLRVVKRRGRRRSHDSYAHDTDYLVNGMYL
ncbi:uncharacterized protein LOC131665389 [Phymastichus coffea]|uniref:uncharacterized protein LOC131665389 n=1 Tax=Phymastichus coffea TaxID=108790 RepID=UPI00273CDD1D|nr:uncharacterized protein LOC131665389 [Phymastichus coffea]